MATILHTQRIIPVHRSTPQKVGVGMGWAFILIGGVGMLAPGFMGMHLSFAHNAIHILSGVAAVIFASMASARPAYLFSMIFGSVYGLLGLAGFVLGTAGSPSVGHLADDRFLLAVIPGTLEFATHDHLVHLVIAAIFLASALTWKNRNRIV